MTKITSLVYLSDAGRIVAAKRIAGKAPALINIFLRISLRTNFSNFKTNRILTNFVYGITYAKYPNLLIFPL